MTETYNIVVRISREKQPDIDKVNKRLEANNIPITDDNQIKEQLEMLLEMLNTFPEIGTFSLSKVERIF